MRAKLVIAAAGVSAIFFLIFDVQSLINAAQLGEPLGLLSAYVMVDCLLLSFAAWVRSKTIASTEDD